MTLSNICDGAFLQKLSTIICFCKKASPQMIDKVLETLLHVKKQNKKERLVKVN